MSKSRRRGGQAVSLGSLRDKVSPYGIRSKEASNIASTCVDVVERVHGVREVLLVPNHLLVVLGMLNIEPENVNSDIFFVEALLHTRDVVGPNIIPLALTITQRLIGRKLNRSCQF